jgi:NAD(P)-dependent dehydrogenase (short-subunit alcohol dehydrogenase family)
VHGSYKGCRPKPGAQAAPLLTSHPLAALAGAPFEYIDYAASKGAIDSMTIGLAKEVARKIFVSMR